MADLSVKIVIGSKGSNTIIINQLVLMNEKSNQSGWDIIKNIASESKKAVVLQHILAFIFIHSKEKNDDQEKSEYIEAVALKEETQESIKNIPMNTPLYPLLVRHQYKSLNFLICDSLMIQSQAFLSQINNGNRQNTASIPLFHNDYKGESRSIPRAFSYKRFFNRRSPIAGLHLAEINSLYHIFGAILIIFLTGILTNEALEKGVLHNFHLIQWNFGQSDKVLMIWLSIFFYSFGFVLLFDKYKNRGIDRLNFGAFYALLIVPLIYVPFRLIRHFELPVASASIIACEQIRFTLKIHAYIFEMFRACHMGQIYHCNINTQSIQNEHTYLQRDWLEAWEQCMNISALQHSPPAPSPPTSEWSTPAKTRSQSPDEMVYRRSNVPIVVQIVNEPLNHHLQSFLNFIFCPSLVYRWSYPKYALNDNKIYKTNWENIFHQALNMMFCLLFVFVIFYFHICPSFCNTPFEEFTVSGFLSSIFSSAISGMLLVMMCFFGVIHCWLNMWSEITGYCDRVFYSDWWNATSFASYSKKWNLVIYNWANNYFFLPMLEMGYSKETCDLLAFWLWAACQEYVFFAVSGSFYPVLLISCVLRGLLFFYIRSNNGNNSQTEENEEDDGSWSVLLWIMLFLQNGFFVSVYAREWYAKMYHLEGKISLDDATWMPYSWQLAIYPNGTNVSSN